MTAFEKHIERCRNIIKSDHVNSIVSQIDELLYNDCLYRSFNFGLEADKSHEIKPKTLIHLVHRMYFDAQVLRVRRLLDKSNDAWSLRRLFEMIYANQCHYSRKKYCEMAVANLNSSAYSGAVEFYNSVFDIISGVDETKRKDADKLNVEYLESIKKFIESNDVMREYADARVAHALVPSKYGLDEKMHHLSLDGLDEQYRKLSWLSYTLSYYCIELVQFIPSVIADDQFNNWVGTIFQGDIEGELYRYWNLRSEKFENWERQYWYSKELYLSPENKAVVKVSNSLDRS